MEKYTHYSYLENCGRREPTGLYCLEGVPPNTRRTLIHNMLINGELVAILPFPEISNLRQLRGALQWSEDN
jgi:hypothetical protein